MNRCGWCDEKSELYVAYHDKEWGVPVVDDQRLFEMLVLEGMQAGLSWLTILKKRYNFRVAFDGFEAKKVAQYGEDKFCELLDNPGIIRNKLKLEAAVKNAQVFVAIQGSHGSFARYLWNYVNNKPVQNSYRNLNELPAQTELSVTISKDLKKRGMNFVGPTIVYAYMQSVGMVNDHEVGCFRYHPCKNMSNISF